MIQKTDSEWRDELTPEQKELYDSIASGPRAKKRKSLVDEHRNLTGPFNAFLHNPALGKHWSAIGETLRFRSRLDKRLFELAILVIAVHWRSGHEWAAHAALARAVPIAVGVVVLIAGAVQFTTWKARQLVCCRDSSGLGGELTADARTAWRYGVRLGVDCGPCCANLMVILLVVGVMDLRAMAVVTAAITAERLAPAGERVARMIGTVVVGAGLVLIARAAILPIAVSY